MDTDKTLTLGTMPASEPAPVATPENTPLPGGGSWCWNSAKSCWDENTTPYAPPAPSTATTKE